MSATVDCPVCDKPVGRDFVQAAIDWAHWSPVIVHGQCLEAYRAAHTDRWPEDDGLCPVCCKTAGRDYKIGAFARQKDGMEKVVPIHRNADCWEERLDLDRQHYRIVMPQQ